MLPSPTHHRGGESIDQRLLLSSSTFPPPPSTTSRWRRRSRSCRKHRQQQCPNRFGWHGDFAKERDEDEDDGLEDPVTGCRSRSKATPIRTLKKPLNPRARRYLSTQLDRIRIERALSESASSRSRRGKEEDTTSLTVSNYQSRQLRGGQGRGGIDAFVKVVSGITQVLIAFGSLVLPPTVAVVGGVIRFYRALPKDVIAAQIGLMCAFLGGYYPTLFSSIQAAQQCGIHIMIQSVQDLVDEAMYVIRALDEASSTTAPTTSSTSTRSRRYEYSNQDDSDSDDDEDNGEREKMFYRSSRGARSSSSSAPSYGASLRKTTGIVLATVDPAKINSAAGALYTTWLGVSSILQREYARVISLSLTMAHYLESIVGFAVTPVAKLCVESKYHQWIPVVIGWGCKAASMNVAWRIQRVMTAATSAVAGGFMFARAVTRILSKRGYRWFGVIRPYDSNPYDAQRQNVFDQDDVPSYSVLDEIIAFMIAGLGFYTQFEAQWRNGFAFDIPYPISLLTWPLDWAEQWIQWQITTTPANQS